MITLELLRHFPYFKSLSARQLKAIASIANEESFKAGDLLFREKQSAEALYILLSGDIELYFTVEVEYHPELRKELTFGTVSQGEIFSISSLIEPYILTSSARAIKPSQVIKIDATELRGICTEDDELAYTLIQHVGKVAMQRLKNTRLQLAEAYAASLV
jgi:CRP-like cAMP-binding protein